MRTCIALIVALATMHAARTEISGLRVWVAVEDGAEADPVALADAGIEAVALPEDLATEATVDRLHAAGLQALGIVAVEDASGGDVGWTVGLDGLVVTSLPPDDAEGRPAWQVDAGRAAEGSLEHLLAVKRSGEHRTAVLRELASATDLPIYLAMPVTDDFPETARWRYLDRHALLSEGTVDGVLLAGAALDLRRPRLSTTRPIVAGIAARSEPSAAAMTILRSRDADVLFVPASADPIAWLARLRATLEGLERAERDRIALSEAVARGELTVVAGLEPGADMDLATIHGVAQSFTLDEPARVAAVGLFCTLRGPDALGQEDVRVTIRLDAEGVPDMETVLAEGAIPPAAYSEPGFHWGYARLNLPIALEAGRTYWLHAENTTGGGNSFIWRITRDGTAYSGGNAWSRTYDYQAYDWVFRVLAEGRGEQ